MKNKKRIKDFLIFFFFNTHIYTVVPALGDPRRERPPAVYGHFVNVPTHFNVKLPVISGHLPNADADSHLLVVGTCYSGQCKQMPRFRWSFQPKIACAHPNLRPSVLSNFRAVVWWPTSNIREMPRHREWWTTWLRQINPFIGYVCFTTSRRKSHIFCLFNPRCRRTERFLVLTNE